MFERIAADLINEKIDLRGESHIILIPKNADISEIMHYLRTGNSINSRVNYKITPVNIKLDVTGEIDNDNWWESAKSWSLRNSSVI